MASVPGVEDSFEMGRVVSRAFGTIGRNIGLIVGITLLIVALPSLLLRPFTPDPAAFSSANAGSAWMWLAIVMFVGFFSNYLLLAALTYTMVTDMNGDKPAFGKAIGIGLRFMVPLLLLAIVSLFGIYFAMIFLIIPGLIVAVMWSVAAPAMVAEKLGVFAALGRSRALTKGWRWRIFALLIVAFFLTLVPFMLMSLTTGALGSAAANDFSLVLLINTLFSSLAMMILIAIDAAIYVELRAVKEGTSTETLASIFA